MRPNMRDNIHLIRSRCSNATSLNPAKITRAFLLCRKDRLWTKGMADRVAGTASLNRPLLLKGALGRQRFR